MAELSTTEASDDDGGGGGGRGGGGRGGGGHGRGSGDGGGDDALTRLHARIAELEALLEARTHTIVGLAAQLAEFQGTLPTFAAARLAEAERQLAELRATKILRYSSAPRRVYGQLRARRG